MKKLVLKPETILFVTLVIIGIFLRFYNLSWGDGYFFHPDERNIASLVTDSFKHPFSTFAFEGTFSYGNFITIIIFEIVKFFSFISHGKTAVFEFSILLLRIQSALFSILISFILYHVTKLYSREGARVAFFLSIFSVGFIQAAHFGMFDTFIAFCILVSFFFSALYLKQKKVLFIFFSLLCILCATAAKINTLLFAIIPLILFLKTSQKKILFLPLLLLVFLPIILSPYYVTSHFYSALLYEQRVVTGAPGIFYTQSFVGTIPILFQLIHIFPFLLNPLITFLIIPSFFYCILTLKKNSFILLLLVYFSVSFFPSAFLFTKWTRYMLPSIPFLYIIIGIFIADCFLVSNATHKNFYRLGVLTSLFISVIFSFSYFYTVFFHTDSRVKAASWAQSHINQNSRILTESFDLGIMPFQKYFTIQDFNFYELDQSEPLQKELSARLETADYVILPSQRLIRSRLQKPNRFPKGYTFYKNLIEENGYQLVYKTPCDLFCKLAYLTDPTYQFEETVEVFDHPTVFIFKKQTRQ